MMFVCPDCDFTIETGIVEIGPHWRLVHETAATHRFTTSAIDAVTASCTDTWHDGCPTCGEMPYEDG